MDLADFLRDTQAEVKAQMSEGSPFAEIVFTDVVTRHMAEIGMTFEPVECHYQGKFGNSTFRLSGYSVSDDQDQLDLFVSLYEGVEELTQVPEAETKVAVEQCLRFLGLCAEGKMAPKLDPSSDVRSLAETLQAIYDGLEQVRIYVLTDRVAKSKSFKTREIGGKAVRLEVMDIERLHRHWSEGKPRDELVVDFTDVSGAPLPCVYVPGENADYDYALTAIPGEALRLLYEKFGARLLEANVRSFLSVKGKGVNAGIQATLRAAPGRFMAYNNGIVLVADEMRFGSAGDGSTGIAWLKGLQIVNGGQTTATIYFSKKKFPEMDLGKVRVPAKIIVMKAQDPVKEEALVSDISRFANSQNAVRQSDLSANKPFHVEIERLSLSVYCPRRRRALVLRAGCGQLQHDACPRRDDARQAQDVEGRNSGRAPDHQDGIGQIHRGVGQASRYRQQGFAEELRSVHGISGRSRGRRSSTSERRGLQGDDREG